MNSKTAFRFKEAGILLLRIGLGVILVLHGYPQVFGGPEVWQQTGQFMNELGISAMPVFFGFLAGIINLFGGLSLIFGVFFRPGISLLILLMLLKTIADIGTTPGSISLPLVLLIVFISLLLIGPGSYQLDEKLKKRSRRRY